MGNLKAEHRGHKITSREWVDTGLQWPVVPYEMSQWGPRGTWASCCVSTTQRPIPFLSQGARREGWRCLFPTWFSNLSKKKEVQWLASQTRYQNIRCAPAEPSAWSTFPRATPSAHHSTLHGPQTPVFNTVMAGGVDTCRELPLWFLILPFALSESFMEIRREDSHQQY